MFLGGIFFLVLVISAFAAPTVQADPMIPALRVTVGDTTGNSGQQNSVITVTMDNVFDTVAAFEIWLRLSRPDIMLFQTDTITVWDTTYWACEGYDAGVCTSWVASADSLPWDSIHIEQVEAIIGDIDTAGSLLSGWEYIQTRSLTGNGTDIKVSGIADRLTIPGSKTGVAPQGGGVLFKLRGDILSIPDTLEDRTVDIFVQPFLDHFNFSRPDGSSIGITYELRPDTNYYRCLDWLPPDSVVCLDWEKVIGAPYDSIKVETDTIPILDTAVVDLIPGSLTVNSGLCGDIVQPPDGFVDVADLTFMIDYLFLSGDAPDPIEMGNVDCQGTPQALIDVGDLTTMIEYLFITFEPFCCM